MNIIQRSASIFDEITVIIAENRNKQYLFSAQERLDLMGGLVEPWKNVSVALCTGLIVDFLKGRNIPVLIRGIRGGGDFSYEFELSLMNRALNPGIETIFFTTDPKYVVIRSSSIKELASFGGNVSAMVPGPVARALEAKFNSRQRESGDRIEGSSGAADPAAD